MFRLHQGEVNATGLARYAKVSMYIVDRGASLHMMALSSFNNNEKKTIRQSNNILGIQTTKGKSGFRHAGTGPYRGVWRLSMDTFGEDSPSVLSQALEGGENLNVENSERDIFYEGARAAMEEFNEAQQNQERMRGVMMISSCTCAALPSLPRVMLGGSCGCPC